MKKDEEISAPKKRGGKRPGAGRKPAAHNVLKKAIREQAQEHGEAALQALVTIAKSRTAPPAARVSAATAILDRAYGKPLSSVEHTGKGGKPIEHDHKVKVRVILVPPKVEAPIETRPLRREDDAQ
ncbi:hypothetical protein [Gemmobacter megaterium]|uniref:hypothetical protein n=1 Tax=Gemmobacter megaterium TaxID=1086013 RepID=UPI0013563F82|nr:hypothetical protein [Gemmobacter megaterium]